MTKGQILPESRFGKALTEVARQSLVICEIGTWHGQGSTLCLALGLQRLEQRMWSIEQDTACYQEATALWHEEPRITFINERALDVLDQLPAQIDLLLIDGDDWTGFSEFGALWQRCKWIALDDTKETKGRQSREFALKAGWKALHDDLNERNGWAIFEVPG